MKNLINSLIGILFLGIIGFSTSSCNRDVEGCMDAQAENFNPDANVDDGSCFFARDKFIGSFVGSLQCQAPLPNAEEFTVTISEGLSDVSEVEISFQNTPTPIPVLTGTISGNNLTIESMTTSIALNPLTPDIKTDLTFSGMATINDTEDELTGTLSVLVASFGATLTCQFTATKQ